VAFALEKLRVLQLVQAVELVQALGLRVRLLLKVLKPGEASRWRNPLEPMR